MFRNSFVSPLFQHDDFGLVRLIRCCLETLASVLVPKESYYFFVCSQENSERQKYVHFLCYDFVILPFFVYSHTEFFPHYLTIYHSHCNEFYTLKNCPWIVVYYYVIKELYNSTNLAAHSTVIGLRYRSLSGIFAALVPRWWME